MIFGDILRATTHRNPQQTALIFGARRWSYAQLDTDSDRLAAGMHAAGIERNDRVGLFVPNCPELILAYLACFKLGVIAVPLNHRYRAPEAEYALSHSGATTLIVHIDKLADAAGLPFDKLGITRRYLVGDGTLPPGIHPFAELMAAEPGKLPPAKFDERQLTTIMYTSGTTARPKGVVHSHQTLAASARVQCAAMGYTDEDVQLVSTSACHCAATYGILFPNFYVGGTAVLVDAPTPQQVVEAIVTHGVTRCQMLPATLQDLVEYLEAHPTPLPSLRSFLAGGDVVPLDTHERFRKVIGFDISEVCGMTEAITYCTNPPFGKKKLGSIGQPVAETEIRIADEAGRELPADTVGELQIKGPANMVGYWNDTLNTQDTYRDGWLASGDLGRQDTEGYFWFVGRKKEIIIRGGSNISPLEIEEVIDQHPAVHNSGVVGLPDAHWGQVVIAYVSPRPEAPALSENELRAFVAERIAEYKVPERFIFLPRLPLNASNKIDRHKLHDRVLDDVRGKAAAH